MDNYHQEQPIQGTDKVNFGQHCGETYQEMYWNNQKYSDWVLATIEDGEPCCEGMKRLGRYLTDMERNQPREPRTTVKQWVHYPSPDGTVHISLEETEIIPVPSCMMEDAEL